MNKEPEEKVKVEKEEPETMQLSYSIEIKDKDGKVVQRVSGPAHSYVRQFYELMSVQAQQAGLAGIIDTDGAPQTILAHAYNFFCYAPATITAYGIRIGKGSTAVTISDYCMETPLEEGVGVDQVNHLATTRTVPAVVGTTCSFDLLRAMVNNSLAIISNIREIGIYMRAYTTKYVLGVRDIVPSLSIPIGGTMSVKYTFSVTV